MRRGDISSILLFIAKANFALFTWKLVAETVKMRKAQTEPKISIISLSNFAYINIIEIIIENIGLSPAYDIRLEIKPDFEMRKGYWLSNIKLLKEGLHYLAPRQSYQFFYD